jgi:hypothetical protein
LDPNGFLLNPRWLGGEARPDIQARCRFRIHSEELDRRTLWVTRPGCLGPLERTTVTINEAHGAVGFGFECTSGSLTGKIHGHVNWWPVTLIGQLKWHSFSSDPGDHDINIDLVQHNLLIRPGTALTSGNAADSGGASVYHLEFYRDETTARLPSNGHSFWHSLDAYTRGDKSRALADSLVSGRFAIVTGLYGLDAVHTFQAELHPVYAMAVLEDARVDSTGQASESWALMVRDRGTEGDCAVGEIPLFTGPDTSENQHFVFDLGSWPEADSAIVSTQPSWSSQAASKVRARFVPGGHLYVDVMHPRPTTTNERFLFLGSVNILWHGPRVVSYPQVRFRSLRINGLSGYRVGKFVDIPRPPPKPVTRADSSRLEWALSWHPVTQGDSLHPLPVGRGGDIEPPEWQPATNVVTYRAQLWTRQEPPVLVDCSRPTFRYERLCLGSLEVGLSPFWRPQQNFFGVSVLAYLPAQTVAIPGEGGLLGVAGAILSGFSYRFEAGYESFRLEQNGSDEAFHGAIFRVSPSFGPSARRMSSSAAVEPYALVSPGFAVLTGQGRTGAYAAFGLGVGFRIIFPVWDVFVEYDHDSLAGFQSQWRLAWGIMTPVQILF